MADKTQQESEAYVKLYQLEPIAKSLEEVKQLIRDQNGTYVTTDNLALTIQKLEAKDEAQAKELSSLNGRIDSWRKFAISLALVVAAQVISTAWQYIMNNGRVQ